MTLHVSRLPFSLDPLIAEAKRRMRRRRVLLGAGVLALAVGGVVALLLTLGTSEPPPTTPPAPGPVPLVADGAAIVATLPDGWSSSVGPGFQGAHRVAWIDVADFRLPAGAARHEGTPDIPAGKVLVVIGDFYPAGSSKRWPSVTTLRMPRALIRSSRWWQVRWKGRALAIQVTFGSAPTSLLIREVEQVLGGIGRGHFR